MIALEILLYMRPSVHRSVHIFHPTAIHRQPFYLSAIICSSSQATWDDFAYSNRLGAITRFNNIIKALTSNAKTAAYSSQK